MDDFSLLRFSRHLMLKEIDLEQQQALMRASVLVVGCGGLGASAIPMLAASGVGTLLLCDPDRVELSNLQRQIAYTVNDIGRLKVEAAADRARSLNPAVQVTTLAFAVDATSLRQYLDRVDVILDCSDNASTRCEVNQASVLSKTPLISGAAARFEGQLAVFDPRLPDSPCYACVFDTGKVSDDRCATTGVFAPLVGVIGSLQAAETMKLIMQVSPPPVGRLVTYDALSLSWRELRFKRNPACAVCAESSAKTLVNA